MLFKYAAFFALGVSALAAPRAPPAKALSQAFSIRTGIRAAFKAPSKDLPVVNTIPLVPTPGHHAAAKINAFHKASLAAAGKLNMKGYSPMVDGGTGTDYVTPVKFGNQTLNLIVDTGSSDTWAPVANYTCIDLDTYMPASQASCAFGPTWNLGESNFHQVPGQRLDVSYGDGTFARGMIGTETITVAQIQIVNQEVGAVNSSGWNGNGGDSGLLGMAFPALDNAYPIGASTEDRNRILYDPLFVSMYRSGQIAPVFALNIVRNGIGSLSLGGIPNDVTTTSEFAVVPFEYTLVEGISNTSFTFYTVNMTATWTIFGTPSSGNGTANTTTGSAGGSSAQHAGRKFTTTGAPFAASVDSGTTAIYLPEEQAFAYNKGWNPPAESTDFTGSTWTVACDAKPPSLMLNVGGQAFPVAPEDLIFHASDGTCASIVFAAGEGTPNIIGDAWLRSVLVVHDIGASELRVASTL